MSGSRTSSSLPGSDEFVLPLADVAHLFTTPPIDPLAESPTQVRGISGFDFLLGVLRAAKPPRRPWTLVLHLPAEKAAAEVADQAARALHRHAQSRIEEERRELRVTYRYGWKVAGIAIVLLAVCLALSSVFASDLTEGMRPLVRQTFEYGFEIIGWVLLWHPVEVLLFSPLAIRSRIATLETLASCSVVIRPGQAGR